MICYHYLGEERSLSFPPENNSGMEPPMNRRNPKGPAEAPKHMIKIVLQYDVEVPTGLGIGEFLGLPASIARVGLEGITLPGQCTVISVG